MNPSANIADPEEKVINPGFGSRLTAIILFFIAGLSSFAVVGGIIYPSRLDNSQRLDFGPLFGSAAFTLVMYGLAILLFRFGSRKVLKMPPATNSSITHYVWLHERGKSPVIGQLTLSAETSNLRFSSEDSANTFNTVGFGDIKKIRTAWSTYLNYVKVVTNGRKLYFSFDSDPQALAKKIKILAFGGLGVVPAIAAAAIIGGENADDYFLVGNGVADFHYWLLNHKVAGYRQLTGPGDAVAFILALIIPISVLILGLCAAFSKLV